MTRRIKVVGNGCRGLCKEWFSYAGDLPAATAVASEAGRVRRYVRTASIVIIGSRSSLAHVDLSSTLPAHHRRRPAGAAYDNSCCYHIPVSYRRHYRLQ